MSKKRMVGKEKCLDMLKLLLRMEEYRKIDIVWRNHQLLNGNRRTYPPLYVTFYIILILNAAMLTTFKSKPQTIVATKSNPRAPPPTVKVINGCL
jgi:hypothetical protein